MTIRIKDTKVHWNYFLALESDVGRVARFVEFAKKNFATYSIELAHLLMAAASEVDVVAKLVCALIQPTSKPRNIHGYAAIILPFDPRIKSLAVVIPRFGVTLKPWVSWAATVPPLWWTAYNRVKHHRDTSFEEANLGNCLNAVAALFSLTVYYYALLGQRTMTLPDGTETKRRPQLSTTSGRAHLTSRLFPKSDLFRLRSVLADIAEAIETHGPVGRVNRTTIT